MHPALDLLARYAACHRDRRNLLSHFVGVPLIVFALGLLLARPGFAAGELHLTPAWVVASMAAAWYLVRGGLVLGASVALAIAALVGLAEQVAVGGTAAWLAGGAAAVAVGWAILFVGHWYEGKAPAFTDDLTSCLVGPLFVTAEALFALGWNARLAGEIERRAGPTHLRDLAKIA